jgi:hypothetical protein
MEALLGYQIGFWDYVTFVALFVIGAAGLSAVIFIRGLPGGELVFRRVVREQPGSKSCDSF